MGFQQQVLIKTFLNNPKMISETIALITRLEHYNQWRQGADVPMPESKEITKAINDAIKLLKKKTLKQKETKIIN